MAAIARPQAADSPPQVGRTRTRAKKAAPEPISVKEAIDRYPEQWIAMEVTAYDEDQWPTHGYVVAHGRSNKRVWRAVTKLLAAVPPGDPPIDIDVFIGRHMLRTWDEVKQALARLEASDEDTPALPFR